MIPRILQRRAIRAPRPPWRRSLGAAVALAAAGLVILSGCARYNTFYNAEKAFRDAERAREEAIKEGIDVGQATGAQRQNYERAIAKAQKVLDMFPGHSLSDDALFLQGKAHHRLASYRMSIRQIDLLFTNFPQTPYMEEALFLQAVNYLMINDAARSRDLLDLLERQFPDSRFQAEALRASGDNAHALRDWEAAVEAYRAYLERFPRGEDWDDSTLRLAEALWELGRYEEAVTALQPVIESSVQADRQFRARLLACRSLVRLGRLDEAEAMIPVLKSESEIHGERGMVGLVEAEILLARDQRSSAVAMLEGMPEDQLTREVKPIWADMLGYAYLADEALERENLEKARDYFQQAVGNTRLLAEPERSRNLLTAIRDYLAAQNQLPDARPDRAASLRLQQANTLLFSFERPQMAYDLYTALAADSTADSTVAPRAIYGAMLLQETHFARPDSAEHFARQLMDRYPDSPQAFEVRSGADYDLLSFLFAQELAARQAGQAALGDRQDGPGDGPRPGLRPGSGLRRRMIYLQRRPHLVFPPTPAALEALERRRQERHDDVMADLADSPTESAADTSAVPADTTATAAAAAPAGPEAAPLRPRPVAADSLAAAPPDTQAGPGPSAADPDTTGGADEDPQPEAKPERPRRWDF